MKKMSLRDPGLQVGQPAPDFTLNDHEGNLIVLREFLGRQPVVLIFYPGDETPDCIKQLCAIRDDWSEFKKYNAMVYGVNQADAESHTKFWRHHGLKTPLLVDPGRQVAAKYGAIKKFFGHEITRRSVVIIDKQGMIRYLKRGLPPVSEIINALATT